MRVYRGRRESAPTSRRTAGTGRPPRFDRRRRVGERPAVELRRQRRPQPLHEQRHRGAADEVRGAVQRAGAAQRHLPVLEPHHRGAVRRRVLHVGEDVARSARCAPPLDVAAAATPNTIARIRSLMADPRGWRPPRPQRCRMPQAGGGAKPGEGGSVCPGSPRPPSRAGRLQIDYKCGAGPSGPLRARRRQPSVHRRDAGRAGTPGRSAPPGLRWRAFACCTA